jgi:hypothetical protein
MISAALIADAEQQFMTAQLSSPRPAKRSEYISGDEPRVVTHWVPRLILKDRQIGFYRPYWCGGVVFFVCDCVDLATPLAG